MTQEVQTTGKLSHRNDHLNFIITNATYQPNTGLHRGLVHPLAVFIRAAQYSSKMALEPHTRPQKPQVKTHQNTQHGQQNGRSKS